MASIEYVAFLDLLPGKAGTSYIGAVLVTDFLGVPVEFRCTHPVRPTEVQKQLYGSTLEKYIGAELCGKPLLKSVQNTPKLTIIKTDYLLAVRPDSVCPVLYVQRAGDVLSVDQGADRTPKELRVEPKNSALHAVVVRAHDRFSEDVSTAKEHLTDLLDSLDPLEPFGRITKAVEALIKQDVRFQ